MATPNPWLAFFERVFELAAQIKDAEALEAEAENPK